MWQPKAPKKASTVILVRPHSQGKFEIFMTRRPMEMKFLGGFYVFPGGSIHEEDYTPAMLRRCRGLSPEEASRILGSQLSPEMSMAHWVAAIRELYEEAGVLLCVTESGEPLDLEPPSVRTRLAEKRKALVDGSLDFLTLLTAEGLYCNAGNVVFFYHRITPEIYSMRFDTRFYLARLPDGQTPLARSEEVIDGRWVTPQRALESCHSGDFPIIPPTTTSLQTLAGFDSWESLRNEYGLP